MSWLLGSFASVVVVGVFCFSFYNLELLRKLYNYICVIMQVINIIHQLLYHHYIISHIILHSTKTIK
jgi:hypothetical protein